jgi:hypothetical protein
MREFEKILAKHGLIEEAEFVRGDEGSELPDAQDDISQDGEEPESPEVSEKPPQQDSDPSEIYSNREKNILEIALKLHLNNTDIDLESRNELDSLFQNEDWQSLHRRLITIVDGLDISTP